MCGIAGILSTSKREIPRERLDVLSKGIAHRGPDSEGKWVGSGIGLVHRRLAIVDLHPTGAQPMHFGDLTIVFNGEIYNYQTLRSELEARGEKFASTSDTEVILHLYANEGKACLKKLHGMFAFVIWDAKCEELFFARDRVGKKPFYYRFENGEFLFASEVSALLKDRSAEIDRSALRLFFGLQYVPSPLTGFKGIAHLPPSSCGFVRDGKVEIETYDHFGHEPIEGITRTNAVSEIRRLLKEAVRLRLIADVDVGAFLSGGIDSSAVVCLMKELKGDGIKTFTMGFPNLGLDERAEAAWLAKRLGTEHHAFEAKPTAAVALLDQIVPHYGSPYADASALPTWLLAEQTSKHVKVAMTGDGGDELFGGYRRYRAFAKALHLRDMGLSWFAINGAWMMDRVTGDPRYRRFAATLEGARKSDGKGYADLFTGSYFNRDAVRDLLQPEFLEETKRSDAGDFIVRRWSGSGLQGAMNFDFASYLPDDLNVKMDRATMAHGLEARSPLLDQNLVSFVRCLPNEWHFSSKQQKPLLVEAMQGIVPDEVFARPKRGFQVPLAQWFRSDLKALFEERCLTPGAKIQAFCRPEAMRRYLDLNSRGADHGNRLWMLLSLATWLERV